MSLGMSESIEQAARPTDLRSQKSYADMRLQPAKGMTSLSTKELESVRKSDGIGKKFARRGQEKVLQGKIPRNRLFMQDCLPRSHPRSRQIKYPCHQLDLTTPVGRKYPRIRSKSKFIQYPVSISKRAKIRECYFCPFSLSLACM